MKRISVRGIVVTEKGLAVIFRRKINGDNIKEYYVIPGGGVENTEDLEEALKRELKEELNIEVDIKDLAFKVETDERIEYFYNCEYISGTFELNGEEIERNTKINYYEPMFIDINKIDEYEINEKLKVYFREKFAKIK